MRAVETLSVPGNTAGVRQAIQAFERFADVHHVPAESAWRLKLVLDEILSNIVRHGSGAGPADIEITFSLGEGFVTVEILDAMEPFNPLLVPPPDTQAPLEAREPGGLGIALVRKLMDETVYERRGDRNHFLARCGLHADR
jgi:serine/threonine-protein kinase RsbW